MRLKNSLIGAVVGAAIGVGILVAAYFFAGAEHTGLALVVALATGLGVRAMASTKGHASYARGALTALIAMVAFVGGKMLVAELAARQAKQAVMRPAILAAPPTKELAGDETTSADADAAVANSAALATAEQANDVDASRSVVPLRSSQPYSPIDFVLMMAAALVAYELGRGSGTVVATTAAHDPESAAHTV